MSVDSAKAFLNKLEGDSGLKASLKAAQVGAGEEAVVKVAADAGFSFTKEDFGVALTEALKAGGKGELSDDQLESVAGGAPSFTGNARRYESYCA